MCPIFFLDVPSAPQMIINFISKCSWIIAITAVLVIIAVVFIVIFTKKNKENKK